MKSGVMECKQIIMHFTVPPSAEDIEVMAGIQMETLPEELLEYIDELEIVVEDLADEAMEEDLELDSPFDLLAHYRKGNQISPGVESKTQNDDDCLILFRRPILDMWCESGDDINNVLRQIIIQEIGQTFDFTDSEIYDMVERHHQGLL